MHGADAYAARRLLPDRFARLHGRRNGPAINESSENFPASHDAGWRPPILLERVRGHGERPGEVGTGTTAPGVIPSPICCQGVGEPAALALSMGRQPGLGFVWVVADTGALSSIT